MKERDMGTARLNISRAFRTSLAPENVFPMRTAKALLISLPLLAGCSVFGIRTVEEPSFEVLREEGAIQIRLYPSTVIAQTIVTGNYDGSSSIAFKRLAGYIFGGNKTKEDISMKAPVVQQQESTKIAMTAPVLQQSEGGNWTMSFVMPAAYSLETLPEPLDRQVTLLEVPGKTVASLRYSGRLNETNIGARSDELLDWLKTNGYRVTSGPRSAAYDPPWTIPFLRRNEVQFDVEPL